MSARRQSRTPARTFSVAGIDNRSACRAGSDPTTVVRVDSGRERTQSKALGPTSLVVISTAALPSEQAVEELPGVISQFDLWEAGLEGRVVETPA